MVFYFLYRVIFSQRAYPPVQKTIALITRKFVKSIYLYIRAAVTNTQQQDQSITQITSAIQNTYKRCSVGTIDTQNALQTVGYWTLILCIGLCASAYKTFNAGFRVVALILCIGLCASAYKTIHNIHYAPFIYRHPTAQKPTIFNNTLLQ